MTENKIELKPGKSFSLSQIYLLFGLLIFLILCLPMGDGIFLFIFIRMVQSSWIEIIFFFLLILIAYYSGNLLLRVLAISSDISLESFLLSIGLGLGIESLFLLSMGVIGILYTKLFFWLTFLFALPGFIKLIQSISKIRFPSKKEPGRLALLNMLFTWIIFTSIMYQFLYALFPPIGYDAMEYHFGDPNYYFQNHQVGYVQGNVYSNFPSNIEMLITWGMLLKNEIIGKLLIWFLGVFTTLTIYYTGRKFVSHTTGLMAAAIFSVLPMILKLNLQGNMDIAMACFSTIAFLCFMNWQSENKIQYLILCGTFVGLALGTKYISLAMIFIPLFILVVYNSYKKDKLFLGILYFLIPTLLLFLPWLIKNYLLTGNPIFPLGYSLLGGYGWDTYIAEKFSKAHAMQFDLARLFKEHFTLFYPFEFSLHSAPYPIIPIVFSPVLFMAREKNMFWKYLIIYLITSYLGWLCTNLVDRFFITLLPFLCLSISMVLVSGFKEGRIDKEKRDWRGFLAIIACIAILLNCSIYYFTLNNIFSSLSQYKLENKNQDKMENKDIFLEMNLSTYPVIQFMNNNLPPNERILYIAEARRAYTRNPVLLNTVFDKVWFLEMANHAKTEEELNALFKELHIQYLFYNPYELKRLEEFYGPYFEPTKVKNKGKLMLNFMENYMDVIYSLGEMKIYKIKNDM